MFSCVVDGHVDRMRRSRRHSVGRAARRSAGGGGSTRRLRPLRLRRLHWKHRQQMCPIFTQVATGVGNPRPLPPPTTRRGAGGQGRDPVAPPWIGPRWCSTPTRARVRSRSVDRRRARLLQRRHPRLPDRLGRGAFAGVEVRRHHDPDLRRRECRHDRGPTADPAGVRQRGSRPAGRGPDQPGGVHGRSMQQRRGIQGRADRGRKDRARAA